MTIIPLPSRQRGTESGLQLVLSTTKRRANNSLASPRYSPRTTSAYRAGQVAHRVYRAGRKQAGPRFIVIVVALLIGLATFWWLQHNQNSSQPAAQGTALAQLENIEIKGRAPRTGYDRTNFGNGWLDPDLNGCDARNDILARDLDLVSYQDDWECVVSAGTLLDPYTGKTIQFQRGHDTSADVQIDHVVALSDAWQKGAQQLSPEQRSNFANDPLNLLAVDGKANTAKSDSDAASWLPPNKDYRCEFVSIQIAVKDKYQLWMTPAEHEMISDILTKNCPNQPAYSVAGAL